MPEHATQPAFTPDSRARAIDRLRGETFDVLILGGGINGAGVARDLAQRARRAGEPLKIALVEQRHFASGTSGKNSQLIHGGLRYLKNLEFGLVKEALRERATLTRIAPHLVEPLKFLIPFFGWTSRGYYGTGLWLYDLLAGASNIGRRAHLSRETVARVEPAFLKDGLTSAATYYDCRVHSTRLTLENIFDAARDGAVIANYARAEEPRRAEAGYRVSLTDVLSGASFETRARKLVDTTGPWQRGTGLRLVRGSHIILPRLNASEHAIAYFAEDGRIIFVIPWGGREAVSLVGTTDVDHGAGADDVRIAPEEIRYLLRIVERLFPASRGVRPLAAYSSLRPLLQSASDSATKTSREHRIWNDEEGILRVAGGKYTTYRLMSEQAADLVAAEIAPRLTGACATAEAPVGGNSLERLEAMRARFRALAGERGIEPQDGEWLARDYGLLAPAVVECLPERAAEGLSPLERAVTRFAVRREMACRLADLVYVSTYWGYERRWTADGLLPFARLMAAELGWDAERIEREVALALEISAVPAYD
ncbi:MAG: glycerol-3-phosphate dehydrogenase/oxidase [Bryobacteraceae bacterium]|nr:glycerol-3-phosphate dehydrogenase/oxidase [Bryobacteraceae bacterium]